MSTPMHSLLINRQVNHVFCILNQHSLIELRILLEEILDSIADFVGKEGLVHIHFVLALGYFVFG